MNTWFGSVAAAVVCVVAVTLPGVPAKLPGDPCGAVGIFLCRFVPFAPDLEDDIDLTRLHPPPTDTSGRPEEVVPGTNICAAGCA